MTPDTSIVVSGHGRQKVFPGIGRCIYCLSSSNLGDEHIIPQALGGNVILQAASCKDCERIIGAGVERRLTHKTYGMFAALRLRMEYKSKRPKERPKSLPFLVTGADGIERKIDVPASKVPKFWTTAITLGPPGIIAGVDPKSLVLISVYTMYDPNDMAYFSNIGNSVKLIGSGDVRDLFRLFAKIAHGFAVAIYGIDSFVPWLPEFILGDDTCNLQYYVAGYENKIPDLAGDHKISIGTVESDPNILMASVRLFCKFGAPEYDVAVGRLRKTA